MTKKDFLKNWRNNRDFRYDMKQKGIRVIGDNVIFLSADGKSVKAVAGVHTK